MQYSNNFINLRLMSRMVLDGNILVITKCWRGQEGERMGNYPLTHFHIISSMVYSSDFNHLLYAKDKNEGQNQPQWLLTSLCLVFSECSLYNMPLEGHLYKWASMRGNSIDIDERLNKALVSFLWMSLFFRGRLSNLIFSVSDHSSIELSTRGRVN